MSVTERSHQPPPLDRQAFPICRSWNYLNHAGVNGLPQPVVDSMSAWLARASCDGSFAGDPEEEVDSARREGARLLGVDPDEVAIVKNTTEGLAFVASALRWCPGDRIVVAEHEFPSNVYPWTALADHGVTVDTVPSQGAGQALPTSAIAETLAGGPPPKLVALSWVQFGRGWRTDIEAVAQLAHQAGALLCVDAIQGLGVLPADFDAWGADMVTAGAHKWLLGPPGVGLLSVRRELIEHLRPPEAGWASVVHREQWDNLALMLDPGARRFEGGTINLPGVAGLSAALGLLDQASVERIWHHVDGLCRHLVAGLEARGAEVLTDRRGEGASGIVCFTLPGHDAAQVVESLAANGIVTAPRSGGIRVSPHGYNTLEEIDALLEVLGAESGAGGTGG